MDVKFGSGAFMRDIDGGRELAESLVHVAHGAGLPTTALLTDMNEPLASRGRQRRRGRLCASTI